MRSLMIQVWAPTTDCRGTAKSNEAVGCVRPPLVMIGRYSFSCANRTNTDWVWVSWWSTFAV